jgi:hypothetical protein
MKPTLKSLTLVTGLSLLILGLTSSPASGQQRPSSLLPQQFTVSEELNPPNLADPTPNYTQAQQLLNQFADTAKLESVTARIRQQEALDLLTSDYVGNPNYARVNASQQYGEYALWENRYRYLNY